MSDFKLRDALLNQNGPANLEVELKMLNSLMELERRRARRLMIWTIGVWVAWVLTVIAMFGSFALMAKPSEPDAPAAPNANQPAEQQQAHAQRAEAANPILGAFMMSVVALGFAALLGLPIIGLVLIVLLMLSPRSSLLRAGVGTVDSHLKMLAAAQKPSASPPSAAG